MDLATRCSAADDGCCVGGRTRTAAECVLVPRILTTYYGTTYLSGT